MLIAVRHRVLLSFLYLAAVSVLPGQVSPSARPFALTTVRSEWQWPALFHVERRTVRRIYALGSDGREAEQVYLARQPLFGQPVADGAEIQLYNPAGHQYLIVDPRNKVVRSRSLDSTLHPRSRSDEYCVTGIRHFGTHFRANGKASIAGLSAARWIGSAGPNAEEEIFLAPELDCSVIRSRTVYKSEWGIPNKIVTVELEKYQLGEPPAALFQPPAGYRWETIPEVNFPPPAP